jgi:magnesium transporter
LTNALTHESTSDLLSSETRLHMRDVHDHALRIIDLCETQREMCSDLMDLYLSSVSNRMNEIIKVLTIITLLFMPPTLVAGIYGMNFKMPQYTWNNGYLWALVIMALTSAIVWVWAANRGWLKDNSTLR